MHTWKLSRQEILEADRKELFGQKNIDWRSTGKDARQQKICEIIQFTSLLLLSRDIFCSVKFCPHFLCWILGVVPFNMWPISSWEENNCCYKLSKCTKWHLHISLKMVEVVILSENSCLFVSCSACNKSYFLLSLR